MSAPRVDVIVEGPEGEWIARALRDAGFDAVRRALESEGAAETELVIVAAAGEEDAWSLLRNARRGAADEVPIIVVAPPDAPIVEPARALAQAVYPRPVPVARLLRKVQTFVSPKREKLSRPPDAETEPPRELTVRLEGPSTTASGRQAMPSSSPPPGPVPEPPSRREVTHPVAELSPWLEHMLFEADRRVFPAAPPADLRFFAGDDSPNELVPDSLLEVFDVDQDALVLDPAAELTFVGQSLPPVSGAESLDSVLPDSTISRGKRRPSEHSGLRRSEIDSVAPPSGRERPASIPPVGSVETAADLPYVPLPALGVGQTSADGRGRIGSLAEGGGVALAVALRNTTGPCRLSLRAPGRERVTLTLGKKGVITAHEGAAARRVLRDLHQEGLALEASDTSEKAAADALDRYAELHPALTVEVHTRREQARYEELADALVGADVSFELHPIDHGATNERARAQAGPSPFAATLPALAIRVASERLNRAWVREALTDDLGADVFELRHDARSAMRSLELPPAMQALLLGLHGQGLDAAVGAASPAGLAGAAYALKRSGLIGVMHSDAAPRGAEVAAMRAFVERAFAATRDANYFAMLGLRPSGDISAEEIARAYDARSGALAACNLDAADLADLLPLRDDALRCYGEARDALANEGVRAAYAAALRSR